MHSKISIIMPVHNSQRYLRQTINSVLNQTYRHFEFIIIDDGSSDDSCDIIKSFNDERIVFLPLKSSHGPAIARNKGLDIASGKYIAFIDSDDVWHYDNLFKQLQFLNKYKLDLVYGCYDFIYSTGQLKKHVSVLPKSLTYSKLLTSNPIKISSCLFKRCILKNHRFPNIGNEDYAFWLILFRNNDLRAQLCPFITTEIRLHSNSVSSNKLRSAKWVWNIYRNQEKLNLCLSIYHILLWGIINCLKHQNIIKFPSLRGN